MAKSRIQIVGFDPSGPFAGLLLPRRLVQRQKETRFRQEWRLTLRQYVALMREFVGPARQRGSIILASFGSTSGGGVPAGNVVLSTHFFDAFAPLGTALSGVQFQNDGDLLERQDPGVDAVSAGEWWDNQPVSGVGDFFDVRALSSGKVGTWSVAAASDNIWTAITSNREWNVQRGAPTGVKTTTATFEVGPTGEATADDAAAITCSAEFDNS